MTDVAVVGAGAAGAGVAFALRAAADVTVFERRDVVGGRAATRRREDCVYDHGANYLKADDPRVNQLVTGTLDDAGLVDVGEPVWTFDAAGSVAEGDDREAHKWSYERGLRTLVERLLDRSGAAVRTGTRVTGLAREPGERGEGHGGWRLRGDAADSGDDRADDGSVRGDDEVDDPADGGDDDPVDLGRYDRVVLTPPAPRTADLLAAADWDDPLRDELAADLGDVPYRTIYSAVLHYPFALERPYYALVNVDGEHPVSWLAREACKPGHVPDGESLLVVQMAHDWSVDHDDEPAESIHRAAARHVAGILDDDRLADPDWTDGVAWRHALVDDAADSDLLAAAADRGLHAAGDWVAGAARVHAALRSGLDTGDRLAERADE